MTEMELHATLTLKVTVTERDDAADEVVAAFIPGQVELAFAIPKGWTTHTLCNAIRNAAEAAGCANVMVCPPEAVEAMEVLIPTPESERPN